MREEGLDILDRRWSKKPAMEISVSKSFAGRKGNDNLLTNCSLPCIHLLSTIRRGCTVRIPMVYRAMGKFYGKTFFVSHLKLFLDPPSHCLFLCRPKRHGKTLLCSLTQYFYDIMNKSHFDKMFPGVDAQDCTPHPSSFMVLSMSLKSLWYNVTI